jgi:tight adherence protein B
MTLPILLACIFFAGLLLIWCVLYFGSRWFGRTQSEQAAHAAQALERMFIFTDARKIIVISILCILILPVAAWIITSNVVAIVAMVIAALVAPRFTVKYIAKRRLSMFEQQLPDALLMIVGALKAGASLPLALESVAQDGMPPVSQEFGLLLRELRMGVDFTTALRNLEKRVPLEDVVLITSGMALAREVGANLAETLDSIGRTIRLKLQMDGKIRSLTAHGTAG